RRSRRRRFLLLATSLLAYVLVLGGLDVRDYFRSEKFRLAVVERIREVYAVDVKLESARFGLLSGLDLRGLEIRPERGTPASLDHAIVDANVRPQLRSLLGGPVVIRSVRISRLDVGLKRDPRSGEYVFDGLRRPVDPRGRTPVRILKLEVER